MNKNSYAGREYLSKLCNKIKIDVIEIGDYPDIDDEEEKRCGGLWKPIKTEDLKHHFNFYNFESLDSSDLENFLETQKYDLGIQGGTGIIRSCIFSKFKLGILNFHPGDLPEYRGCSAPEWQIWDSRDIVTTCHFIDNGIDSGPIIEKRILNSKFKSYYSLRASIYPQISEFLFDVIIKFYELGENEKIKPEIQDESIANYRSYIGQKKLESIKKSLNKLSQ